MFVRIGNTPRDYAWGSTTAIAGLLGTTPSGHPEAELWLGAHAGSPSVILDPEQTDGAADLATWIERDPAEALGAGATRLPYLLKVLAAAGPLSLQAHPSNAQAEEGFARENAEGIPLDSPDRNYKDASHKPELIFALSDTFDALYLPAGNIHAYLRGLGIELMAASDNVLRGGLTPKRIDVPELVSVLDFSPIDAAPLAPERPEPGVEVFRPDVPDFALDHIVVGAGTERATVALPGAAIALCTAGDITVAGAAGDVRLTRGQSVFVTPDEQRLTVTGSGTLFVATPNV